MFGLNKLLLVKPTLLTTPTLDIIYQLHNLYPLSCRSYYSNLYPTWSSKLAWPKNRNRRPKPEPNQNIQIRNRTETLKYSSDFYISIYEITKPNRNRIETESKPNIYKILIVYTNNIIIYIYNLNFILKVTKNIWRKLNCYKIPKLREDS